MLSSKRGYVTKERLDQLLCYHEANLIDLQIGQSLVSLRLFPEGVQGKFFIHLCDLSLTVETL